MDPSKYYGPFRVISRAVAVAPGSSVELCSTDQDRVALILGVSGVNTVNVAPRSTIQVGEGVILSSGGISYLKLTFADDGPLVGSSWFARLAVASTVEVTEVVMDYDPENPLWLRWNPNDGGVP